MKRFRLDAGLGLRELARRVGKSPGYLSDVENGRVPPPSEAVILAICGALDADKGELLSTAGKIDPEVSHYVLDQPKAVDFLRMARRRAYSEEDWEKLSRLAEIADLGKKEGDEG